jgi:dTDP-4-amino-4,6-dideoxygalactose transaminase
MNVPLLDLKAQYAVIRDDVRAAVDQVFESQRFVLGPQVAALEQEIARLCGVAGAVGVASGTDALLLSLKALGIGPGHGIVTTPFTFFATAGAIVNAGARPFFVDIEPAGFNMDPASLAQFLERDCSFQKRGPRVVHRSSGTLVRAIMPIHLYGQCADMEAISEIAQSYRLAVVEDACQALGSRYGDHAAGALGDLGCFSFFPSKNLGGAGDGGMVVSRNGELGERVRLLRNHGARAKYFHSMVGFNSRLDEIQAAVLRVKLVRLEGWIKARCDNAAAYETAFRAAGLLAKIRPPCTLPSRKHIFHQYVIRCTRRDDLRSYLQGRGIGTEVYYPVPLHEQECFRGLGYGPLDFPHAHEAAPQVLALPIYPELRAEQQEYVVRCIAEFYSERKPV